MAAGPPGHARFLLLGEPGFWQRLLECDIDGDRSPERSTLPCAHSTKVLRPTLTIPPSRGSAGCSTRLRGTPRRAPK